MSSEVIENRLISWISRSVINSTKSSCSPVISGLFWSLVLRLVLAINDLDGGAKCILNKLTDDTQSGGVVNKPNTRDSTQEGQ